MKRDGLDHGAARRLRRVALACCIAWLAVLAVPPVAAQSPAPTHADLIYATVGEQALGLDLYLPEGIADPPLVVWVHGGAWRTGSRAQVRLEFLDAGFAVASVDFRQSPVAPFPAQLHDLKAAVRFLRAMAPEYGYDAARIGIAGASSGGHLAALVGATNGIDALEGEVGEHLDQSSEVQAVVNYFGPTNLTTILAQSTPFGLGVREPALELLLGGLPDEQPELARQASPVLHVGETSPPVLILHGDQDPQVPINQAHELVGAYKQHGLDARLEVVYGAAHGGNAFFSDQYLDATLEFLRRVLAPE